MHLYRNAKEAGPAPASFFMNVLGFPRAQRTRNGSQKYAAISPYWRPDNLISVSLPWPNMLGDEAERLRFASASGGQ